MNVKTMTDARREMGEFEEVEIARKDAPDVRFTGRLLAEVDSDTEGRNGGRPNRGRWTRLQLWELKSGAWIAAAIGCSDRAGEIDIGEIKRISDVPDPEETEQNVIDSIRRGSEAGAVNAIRHPREQRVMQFFGWTWLAKKLAEQLGWDTVEVIEE